MTKSKSGLERTLEAFLFGAKQNGMVRDPLRGLRPIEKAFVFGAIAVMAAVCALAIIGAIFVEAGPISLFLNVLLLIVLSGAAVAAPIIFNKALKKEAEYWRAPLMQNVARTLAQLGSRKRRKSDFDQSP